MKSRLTAFLSVLPFILGLSYLISYKYSTRVLPLDWDETDYAIAAKWGIKENALEQNSLSFFDFIRLGNAKRLKDSLIDVPLTEETKDPFYVRHFHPPLPEYYWAVFMTDKGLDDISLRYSNILLILILAVTFAGCLFFFPFGRSPFPFFSVAVILPAFFTSAIFYQSFIRLNFHVFHLFTSLIFILLLVRYLKDTSNRNALLLGFGITLVFLSLETSLFILGGAFLAMLILGYYKLFNVKNLLLIFSSFVCSIIALWPGILRTGSPIKAWLMYVYRMVFANNDEYRYLSLSQRLLSFLSENFIFFIIIIVSIAISLWMYRRKEIEKFCFVPLVIGLVYFLCMVPFIIRLNYQFPAVGILTLFSCIIFTYYETRFPEKWRYFIILGGFCIILPSVFRTDIKDEADKAVTARKNFIEDVNTLKEYVKGKPILVDGAHVVQYYTGIPEDSIYNLYFVNDHNPSFGVRQNFKYSDVSGKVQSHYYGAIAISYTLPVPMLEAKLRDWNYKLVELKNFKLYIPRTDTP